MKQQSQYDCMLACLATMSGRPYADLWPAEILAECEEKKGIYGDTVDKCLLLAGYMKNVDYWLVPVPDMVAQSWFMRLMLRGRRALLQVPSLNYENTQHMVYWDGAALHDPSNKQQYRWLSHCCPNNVWIFNAVRKPPPDELPALTDDMLRYAMAAMGTGSPADAERFRAFWFHADFAYRTPPKDK